MARDIMPETVAQLLTKAQQPAEEALRLHPVYRGKIQTALRCPIRNEHDFAIWYTPGVAAPCKAIAADAELVYEYTHKWNAVAIVSDGSRVLGLGDIGPAAALPVMEGKALLYKYLGGVDAWPVMLATKDPHKIIETVLLIQAGFGGINLEDIAQPKCFRILDTLRARASIPVWHDDQQGTATVILAGLLNALKLVGKDLPAVKITFIGCGAAGVACSRLLFTAGATPGLCKMVDSRGILHQNRTDICKRKNEFVDKWKLCQITNAGQRQGGIPEAMQGVDVVIALSKPDANTIQPAWVKTMARDSIIFACANPIPEIWPWDAKAAGVGVVATGRSDFPNQVNNSLGFPGIFRGTLDVRAKTISEQMCLAAAVALSNHISSDQLKSGRILPTMEDWQVFPKVAAAVAVQAVAEGLARISLSYEQAHHQALTLIQQARDLTQLMMKEKFID